MSKTVVEKDRFGLKPATLEKLSSVFKRNPKVQQVLVYGSRAKGNYREGSDIDITMTGGNLQWSDLQAIEQEIEDLMLPYKVDLSILHQIDNQDLRRHIERWGTPL